MKTDFWRAAKLLLARVRFKPKSTAMKSLILIILLIISAQSLFADPIMTNGVRSHMIFFHV